MTTNLRQLYARELCVLQLKTYQFHKNRTSSKANRYLSSTDLKWQFGNLMCIAAFDNQGYTITEISKILDCSRQAAMRMVDDCLAEGWVRLAEKLSYQASPIVSDTAMGSYLDAYITVLEKTDVVATGTAHRYSMSVKPSYIEFAAEYKVERMNDELQTQKQIIKKRPAISAKQN
tara:strand:- start:614 stop:1138 length:525 start_codon:yes stop_codon:yes gene_type:complete